MTPKESLLIKILKLLKIIKPVEISKSEMCKEASQICSHNCECCVWNAERQG